MKNALIYFSSISVCIGMACFVVACKQGNEHSPVRAASKIAVVTTIAGAKQGLEDGPSLQA